ncbi:hypothetical protein ACK3SF_03255 [Candidatus Nanosalina sp. VS9-1]|uniref:hypothetical protein n=1 Tax=Candidatus Nanosalina sp. VS9-1 TaxID=3388566 RepID=UPI0039E1554B
MSDCLVAVHPIYDVSEHFPDYRLEERSVAAVKNFSGDTLCLAYKDGEGVRRPYGGRDLYGHVIDDPNYGEVPDPVAEMIVKKYDRVFVMGGFLTACVSKFYSKIQSLNEKSGENTEIVILVDLLISQAKKKVEREVNGEKGEICQGIPAPSMEWETNYEDKIAKYFGAENVEAVEWRTMK